MIELQNKVEGSTSSNLRGIDDAAHDSKSINDLSSPYTVPKPPLNKPQDSKSAPAENVRTQVRIPVNKDTSFSSDKLTESRTSYVIFNAYLKRLQKSAYEQLDVSGGLSIDEVTKLIVTSERYLDTLKDDREYRRFIGILLRVLRLNYKTMSASKAREFLSSLSHYEKSSQDNKSLKIFVADLYSNKILMVNLNDKEE